MSGDLNGDDGPDFTNNDDNSYHVVIGSGTDETAVLDGFSITGGNAAGTNPWSDPHATGGGMLNLAGHPTVRNCVFVRNQANPYGGSGGAMFNRDASPRLVNCAFRENAADAGGGMYNDRSSSHVTGCTFEENVARSGGAIVIDSASAPVFSQCTFRANAASQGTGGLMIWGGTPTLIDCRFTANEGAIFNSGITGADDLLLVNCAFERNLGALYHKGRSATLVSCVFNGNTGSTGAAVFNRGQRLALVNCVLSHNIAANRGGGIASERGVNLEIANSILWANEDSAGAGFSAQLFSDDQLVPASWHVHHNCVQGWTDDLPGEGNTSADPRFVDILGPDGAAGTEDDDLHLLPESPCIDAGDNVAVPPDTAYLDGDAAVNEPVPLDLAGKPRFVDAMATVDVGSGTRPIVDMGAFEFALDCNANVFADEEDIALGRSADCNHNEVPDECEADCNANLVVDECDILSGFSMDCTANNTPDECEPDCNDNGQADSCDIASGSSGDCNGNRVPDECEPDCNGNGQPDDCDLQDDPSLDCNQNDQPDECDLDRGVSADCNENRQPDECEDDCNGNSVPDDCDLADGTSPDLNGNDLPDECDVLRYVDRRAKGSNTGMSWNDAYSDLQYAFSEVADAAKGVTMIWVATGVYTPGAPGGDRTVTFQLPGGVAIYGGFAGNEGSLKEREPRRHETVLSCDLNGDDGIDFSNYGENCYHVVTARKTGPGTKLDALVIRGGNADIMGKDNTRDRGAAMFIENAEIQLRNCVFQENFNANAGAAWLRSSNARFHECVFDNNRSKSSGTSGIHNAFESNLAIVQSTIRGSYGSRAIFNGPQSVVLIANTQFSGNSPGAVVKNAGLAFIENCTFSNNGGPEAGATLTGSGATMVVNTIFWNEDFPEDALEPARIDMDDPLTSVSYSCVQAGWTGAGIGNISLDPLFVDPLGADGALGTGDEDLQLLPSSRCINSGDPGSAVDSDGTDHAGEPRIQGCRVDMGAYESSVAQARGDFGADGDVDLADFAALQLCYGTAYAVPSWSRSCLCVFDVDHNETIDPDDFRAFLWAMAGP